METFVDAKPFTEYPEFHKRRQQALQAIDFADIDPPLLNLVKAFIDIPYVFTLQCCWGHFLDAGSHDQVELASLNHVVDKTAKLKYCIAYLALCLENSAEGQKFYNDFSKINQGLNSSYIQFGSSEWFWLRHVNSYIIQVEPESYMYSDMAIVNLSEAIILDQTRRMLFGELKRIIEKHIH